MRALKGLDLKNVITIDIETVRLAEKYEDLPEVVQEAWEYKNKQEGEIPDVEVLAEMYERTSSLYAEFSRVVAVSLCFINNQDKLSVLNLSNVDEGELLKELAQILDRVKASNSKYVLAAHAGKFFDYSYLAKRYIGLGLGIPDILDATGLKPWEIVSLLDTNELYRCGGTGPGSSLQALCMHLNIPSPKVDLVGDEVGKAFFEGDLERISTYCGRDVIATFNVMCRFKGLPIYMEEDVVVAGKSSQKEVNPIVRLINTKDFNDEVKEGLEKILEGKKVLKKDRKILQDIVTRSAINDKMFESDKASIRKEKTEAVDEFFKESV